MLMKRAQEEGLVFNSAYGITSDNDKVRSIQDMPTPENREDLHRFIGMMT